MSRHLVIGASGLVGEHLLRHLQKLGHQVTGTFYLNSRTALLSLDIRKKNAVEGLFQLIRPDIVYLPSAVTNVDYCEKNPNETYMTNVQGVCNVVQGANQIGARLVFFSSDYLFNGMDGPYAEDEPAHPISEYGKQKLMGEHYIGLHSKNFVIVRTTVVYGWEINEKNFVQRLITSLRNREYVRVPTDQVGSPTYAPNLAEAAIELATRRETGPFNIVGPMLATRYEFALAVAKAFDLDTSLILPVTTRMLGQVALRPLSAGLRVEKAQKLLKTSLIGYIDGLEFMTASNVRT